MTGGTKVLTLGKVKSCEYRILSTLVDKLKAHAILAADNRDSKKYGEFKVKFQQIVAGSKLPKHGEYYDNLARLSFDLVSQTPNIFIGDKIRGHYIDFLDKVRCTLENPSVQPAPVATPVADIASPNEAVPQNDVPTLASTMEKYGQLDEEEQKAMKKLPRAVIIITPSSILLPDQQI